MQLQFHNELPYCNILLCYFCVCVCIYIYGERDQRFYWWIQQARRQHVIKLNSDLSWTPMSKPYKCL